MKISRPKMGTIQFGFYAVFFSDKNLNEISPVAMILFLSSADEWQI